MTRAVADAMMRAPKVVAATARVEEMQALFRDDHVHAAVMVAPTGRLLAVVERADLDGLSASESADSAGRLAGRTVAPDADLAATWREMTRLGRRRLAVIDPLSGRLLGLLCLKRSGLGFCSDADVEARRACIASEGDLTSSLAASRQRS